MGRPRKSPAVNWEKVKGVKGTIATSKAATPSKELVEFFGKRKHKQLYVGIYDDVLYRYFVIEED